MASSNKPSPLEAVKQFYELKKQYETTFHEKYVAPILSDGNMSIREKRRAYAALPKPNCVNCGRPVGTLFSVAVMPETFVRRFTARCGGTDVAGENKKCELNINITLGARETFSKVIPETKAIIDKLKMEMIQKKNETLFFGTHDDAASAKVKIDEFEELTAKLTGETQIAGLFIEADVMKNDNPVRAQKLQDAMIEFQIQGIVPFKTAIAEYLKTLDQDYLTDAFAVYKEIMVPAIKNIRKLRHDENWVQWVQCGEETGYYRLYQTGYPQNKENWNKDDDQVVRFVQHGDGGAGNISVIVGNTDINPGNPPAPPTSGSTSTAAATKRSSTAKRPRSEEGAKKSGTTPRSRTVKRHGTAVLSAPAPENVIILDSSSDSSNED